MNPRSWKFLLVGAVVAVALSSAAPQADAHWWGYYQPWGYGYGYGYGCGYGGCYTPTYTTVGCGSYCDGSWYLGWRPGPVRRLLLGRYKWYWGGYSCGCATDCCTGCYSDGCTGCSDCGATTTMPNAPTPAKKPADAGVPTEPAAPAPIEPAVDPTSSTSADSGVLTVWVPYDAKVTVNGLETKSTGSRRQFISYGLKTGFNYKYEVKAEIVRDGQVVEDTQTITLTAGQVSAVAFGFNSPTQQVAAR